MVRSILPLGVALLGAATVMSADPPTCSLNNRCPQDAPCCSQYGQCGAGAFCLGGCDPRMSFSLDACVPAPVCESKVLPMNSLDRIASINEYLGDPTKADWVSQGSPLVFDNSILLTMPANSVGTVLSSTTYMWYGNVKAKMKTSRGAGVVTAFILFSDVKDEIDYEWVGADLGTAQTNFYFQGILDFHNSGNISGVSDTFADFHEYEIQWTPDSITWLVDGTVGRVAQKSDTWNATANQWNFPQTPSRVQLSIWPGGADTNAPGTIAWAGGAIDWKSADITNFGYDFATVGQVEIECFNATSPPGTNTQVSYTYTSYVATNNTVVDGDDPTIIASFTATGLDLGAGNTTSSTGSTASGSSVATVPGGTAKGPGAGNSGGGGNTGGNLPAGSGSSSSSGPKCESTGFSQSCDSNSNTNSGGRAAELRLGPSGLAVVIAMAGVVLL